MEVKFNRMQVYRGPGWKGHYLISNGGNFRRGEKKRRCAVVGLKTSELEGKLLTKREGAVLGGKIRKLAHDWNGENRAVRRYNAFTPAKEGIPRQKKGEVETDTG